jgi:hypothetical protein
MAAAGYGAGAAAAGGPMGLGVGGRPCCCLLASGRTRSCSLPRPSPALHCPDGRCGHVAHPAPPRQLPLLRRSPPQARKSAVPEWLREELARKAAQAVKGRRGSDSDEDEQPAEQARAPAPGAPRGRRRALASAPRLPLPALPACRRRPRTGRVRCSRACASPRPLT